MDKKDFLQITSAGGPVTIEALFAYANAAGLVSGGTARPAGQTIRNISNRVRHNNNVALTCNALTGASFHFNMGDYIYANEGIACVVANWGATNNGETLGLQTTTEYLSIEYPLGENGGPGTFTVATWNNGQPSGSCAPGGNAVTDFIKLPMDMPRGAPFRVHRWQQTPVSGVLFAYGAATMANAAPTPPAWPAFPMEYTISYSTSALALWPNDPLEMLTGSAMSAVSGQLATGTGALGPIAVLGKSSIPSIALYGDSKMCGTQDTAITSGSPVNQYLNLGDAARGIGLNYPCVNMGCPTDTISKFVSSGTQRAAQSQYHQYAHFEYATNDLIGGATAATIEANLLLGYAMIQPGVKISQQTIEPNATSTDSWATLVNQTTVASNPQRVLLNNWIRSQPAPMWDYFEVADVVESSRDSGLWKCAASTPAQPQMTTDGIHPTPYGYWLIERKGPFTPGCFV